MLMCIFHRMHFKGRLERPLQKYLKLLLTLLGCREGLLE